MCWLMVAAAVAGFDASTRTGSFRKASARRLISGGMVAEKNSVWRLGGSILQMRSMSGMKPMSSMRSASSMTRISTPFIRSLPRSNMVEQATRRGDQDIDAAVELLDLIVEGTPPMMQGDGELVVAAVAGEVFLHLRREFARRLEDQRARHARPGAALFEERQHRQHERCGLAGAGLGDAERRPCRSARAGSPAPESASVPCTRWPQRRRVLSAIVRDPESSFGGGEPDCRARPSGAGKAANVKRARLVN
jgi:hypothetical protein